MPQPDTLRSIITASLFEAPIPVEELEQSVGPGALPSLSFLVLLMCSTVIATLGLIANSPAVIIGAMIVAPLMSPIISLSFGAVAGNGKLVAYSLVTIAIGTLLTIGVSFLITELIGWRIGGSEIAARTQPNLLDLGVAVGAGAAAAFAFTRPCVSAALAGIAISVALVPPLCTVGVAISIGQNAITEVGVTLEVLTPSGPLVLFLTNLVGILLAAGVVFYIHYFRRRPISMGALVLMVLSLFPILYPLGSSMKNLMIRNQVHRSLTEETQALLPSGSRVRFTNLNVKFRDGTAHVQGDVVAAPGLITNTVIDSLGAELSEEVGVKVVLEFGVISEKIVRSRN